MSQLDSLTTTVVDHCKKNNLTFEQGLELFSELLSDLGWELTVDRPALPNGATDWSALEKLEQEAVRESFAGYWRF